MTDNCAQNPEGTCFSISSSTLNYFAGAVIDGQFLDAVMGRHYELNGGFAVQDDMLALLMRALAEEVRCKGATTPDFATRLIEAFVIAMAVRHGTPAPDLPVRGGLAARRLRPLLDWIEDRAAEPITLAEMARYAGLSKAHFAREFKRTTGRTPWEHVVEVRLTRAREMLRQGRAISEVAAQCGFSDQSHFGRVFRRKYNLSPRRFVLQSP